MIERDRKIYTPKPRRAVLSRVCGWIFCFGTALMWVLRSKFGIETGDLLIMTGLAVLTASLSLNGIKAEKKCEAQSNELERIREECGKGDYNNDIFFD